MASSARWYLAITGVLALLLLAAHFAVQEHVQKKMRLAVHGWLADHGGSVTHVRYRLLRGELTLEQLHVQAAEFSLDAPEVLLHISSGTMFSPMPFFAQVRFDQPVVRMPRQTIFDVLSADSDKSQAINIALRHTLRKLSLHAGMLSTVDMTVHLQGNNTDTDVGVLQQVDGSLSADGLFVEGMLDAGMWQLQGRVDKNNRLNAKVSLQGMPLSSIAKLSGLSYGGLSTASGDLQLTGDWNQRNINTRGELQLLEEEDAGLLNIAGESTPSGLLWRMACSHVQLAGWSNALPVIVGRSLEDGVLNGEILLHREMENPQWRMGMNGELSSVRMLGDGLPPWTIGLIRIQDAVVEKAANIFTAAQIDIEDAAIGLNMMVSDSVEGAVIVPEVERLVLKNIQTQLFFSDGSILKLPSMRGSGRLDRQRGKLELDGEQADSNSELASSHTNENWSVLAEGDFTGSYTAAVKAKGVPLVRLRPLLPVLSLPGASGAPEYVGRGDFSVSIIGNHDGLTASGQATLHDVRIMQGGDSLLAEQVSVNVAQVDTQGKRQLKQVTIKNWQYQSALHPLTRQIKENPPGAEESDGKEAMLTPLPADVERSPAFPELNWQIGRLVASGGRISVGRVDALIAEKLEFSLRHLSSDKASPFTLSGVIGEGSLRARGYLSLQPHTHVSMVLHIANMLPFVFNDWMHISGMPHFVRGRLDAVLHVNKTHKDESDAYTGKMDLTMHQGLLEAGVFPDDPLTTRGGYGAQALLDRLNHGRKLNVVFPFHGEWGEGSLLGHIGDAGIDFLMRAAGKTSVQQNKKLSVVNRVTRIRLQGKHSFSYNERVRLRQLIRQMIKQPELIAELEPQLGAAPLDDKKLARVRYSQRMIEKYMRRFGIARKRIFPVWPEAAHRRGDAPGIIIRARSL